MQSIGEVIKKYRLKCNKTQEEVGNELFVTKQAVSKWENGKTLPDIQTIRKLVDYLGIPHDEILGETIGQTRKYRSVIKILIPILAASLLLMLFFAFDGIGVIQRRFQSGVCLVVVYENGTVLDEGNYQVTGLKSVKPGKNGYSFEIDYGEVKGTIVTSDNEEIEFGFVNTNDWHNAQISIRIESVLGEKHVFQTVIYKSDNDIINIIENEAIMVNNKASVFKSGI